MLSAMVWRNYLLRYPTKSSQQNLKAVFLNNTQQFQ